MMKRDEETGRTFGNIYLLGRLGDTTDQALHGFKSYYAVAYFHKEPIALQILFLIDLIWVGRHRKVDDFIAGEAMLLIAADPGDLVVLLQPGANWNPAHPPCLGD